ncbi:ABC transporter ATP-binding protein [uncultured Bacteroides sp.]|uniref:ABC transporter ATP-binding protein n=1 Tax=uncultured Bacteroides sp. TaxID=162156 RepID=UPI0025D2AB69|nr:ABC transporter ATP-binding protein [uncultured Bacteroides sp.]
MRIIDGIKWVWDASSGYRKLILLSMLCGMFRMAVSLAFVWLCKYVIDVATHQTAGSLSHGICLMVGCILLQLSLSAVSSRLYASTDVSLSNRMRSGLLTHLLKSRWNGRELFHSGDMLNRMEGDVSVVVRMMVGLFPSVGIVLSQLVGAAAFLLILDRRMAVVILLIMPVALVFSKLYMMKMRKITREIRETDSRVQSHMQENLQHRTLIAALERTPMILNTMGSLQLGLKRLVMQRNSYSVFSSVLVQAGFAFGYVVAFSWGVYGLNKGTVTFGMLTAFMQLVAQVQRPVVDLSKMVPSFINGLTSVERLNELYSLPLEEQGTPVQLAGPVGIRLEHVTFRYPGSEREVLHDFSHDFAPGSLTAVLGETGSGKSTLLRLLLALLQPAEGRILLYAGREERTASPLTRGNFIYVPQGNTLVSGSLRHNLQLGNPEATDEQMYAALHTAAADFVADLSEGLDTPCGEKGEGLSEGQAQRIAIARGLLRSGSIILLDEPTSALDAETTRLLLQRLTEKVGSKTLILITHQEQTARLCSHTVRLHSRQL